MQRTEVLVEVGRPPEHVPEQILELPAWRRWRLVALIAAAALVLCACPAGRADAHVAGAPNAVLRLDSIGKGTGFTPIFHAPVKAPWGLAWRYRCSGRPAEYDMVIWEVINAVDLAYTSIFSHGTNGSGYRMETGETSNVTGPTGKQAGIVLAVHVRTTCRWHIRVIAGTRQVVRRWIPRYVNRSSWTP